MLERPCHTLIMSGASGILIELGVRLVVFGVVFFFAARKNPKVVISAKRATPVVAFVFAALNTILYWALTPILNLATMGAVGFVMPFIVNMLLLIATVRFFRWDKLPKIKVKVGRAGQDGGDKTETRPWIEIQGMMTMFWMAGILTLAHGVLWFALDYLPTKL